ncbi:MAG TPA: exopolysaccharide biosynthesis polyprenyl glycosylphosphotransferase [Actinomycetota bacterium]|nr:exopolysaccharide biosynthesis polyprenyl glycosylphosphotransferase [Actinomycetota bacterium]
MSRTETKRKTVQERGAKPPRPARLAIPVADAAALLAAAAVFGRGSALGPVYGVAAFLALAAAGTQWTRVNPTLGNDLPVLLGRLAVPFAPLAGLAVLGRVEAASLPDLVRVMAAAAVLVPAGRAVAYAVMRSARMRGHLLERVLIVGAGEVGGQLARVLQEHREYGLVPVGFVDSLDGSGLSMPVLGDARALAPTVERLQVGIVIVAFGAICEQELAGVLRACDALPVEVYVVPRFFQFGVVPDSPSVGDVWGIPLVRLRRLALGRSARLAKRAFDLAGAGAGLLLSAPLFAAAALAVRRSSPGPVFFRQLRVGKDGRPFELVKFRTMRVNDDSDTTWSVAGDTRVTRAGRLLRRTHLDELPQLLNVLRGQMSLVGPRPERPHFAHRFAGEVPRYGDRHRVRGGITGWAQVHGLKGDTPIPDRARFDNHYIEHWSLWRDVVIVTRTLANVLLGR